MAQAVICLLALGSCAARRGMANSSMTHLKRRKPMRRASKTTLRKTGKLRARSAKLEAEHALYSALRKTFLAQHPRCAVFPEKRSVEIHHSKGRGKYLNDTSTWFAVSRAGHERIERERAWARERGFLIYGKDGK